MRDVAYIALGSNLGDRQRHLEIARESIARLPASRLIGVTPVEETEPMGPPGQSPYLNQMLAIETELEPHALLAALQEIESLAGRVRRERWGPRTLDLDIVTFEHQRVSDDQLVVPHPELGARDFWRRELAALRVGMVEATEDPQP
ncbi:MAG TPA: 2-amino-4-hydroxy-6-hydroxymethyldihydropteridine diphosphokinase [Gemmatimonadaceae bacterium]|nr:2-amino-4-hydroxy-6-hydroxymethyldihydropteridine diphosphokinase [Gemmatimonadaceae bacterium]